MLAKAVIVVLIAVPLCAQTIPRRAAQHARAAREAERRNDFAAAVQQYNAAVDLLPRSAEMQSNLGVALYFDHQLPRALAVLRTAISLDPRLLAPHLFSGLAQYRLSNPGAAVPELEKAVQINPSDVIARTWLGYAYSAQYQYEPALVQFQAACRLDPGNVDVWYALGQTDLQLGKQATLQLLALAPDGGRAWQLAGEQMVLQEDRKDALKDFEGAAARRSDLTGLRALVAKMGGSVPAAPRALPDRAVEAKADNLYRKAHNAEEAARAAFSHVVQMAPDSYRAHQIMAAAYADEHEPQKAIAQYRTVLELEPDMPGIHEAIGNILLSQARLPQALKEFEAELQIQPRSASVLTNAAQVMLTMGNDGGAAKMLASALRMDQPPLQVYVLLGKLDLRRHDFRSAVSELTRYTSVRKNDSSAYYLLARAYRALGNKEQMQRTLDLFERTSLAAKARSGAQVELESFNDLSRGPVMSVALARGSLH